MAGSGLVEPDQIEDVGCPLTSCPAGQAAQLTEGRQFTSAAV